MAQTVSTKLKTLLSAISAGLLIWVPFAAFLTVYLSGLTGHYTAWRLAEDALAVFGALLALASLFKQTKLGRNLINLQVVWLIVFYALLEIGLGLVALVRHDVSHKALGYGLDIDLRFFVFFLLCLVAGSCSDWLVKHWRQLTLIPTAVVIFFGLLQHFVLSSGFLSHFGYNSSTIMPYETVNSSIRYLREFSTLRGSDPFGAYLVLVLTLGFVLLLRAKNNVWRTIYGLLIAAGLVDLFYSYSRSAYAGLVISFIVVILLSIKLNPKHWLWLGGGMAGLIILAGGVFAVFHNNPTFQNTIYHTSNNSSVKISSNQGHLSALKQGFSDAVHQPLGRGPGTAGPASVYNDQRVRIPENYFVQIAEEIGWLGLVIFLLIYWLVAKGLYRVRTNPLALGLLAALVGLTFINLLSQAWTDNTLSYLWWGLAGIALAPILKGSKIGGEVDL